MKLRLTINDGTLAGKAFELENGFLSVGRADSCSVRLDPLTERIASKQHAFIERKPDGFYVSDNQSTNGTLVNGEIVTTRRLGSGDQVQFGRNGVIAYINISGDEAEPIPREEFREQQVQNFNSLAQQQPQSVQTSLVNFGLNGAAAVKPEPASSGSGKIIGIVATVGVIVVLAILVMLLMFGMIGLGPAIVASIVAFVPMFFYIIPFLWLDRYDPEPSWLLALAFSWGALVSVIAALIINTIFGAAVSIAISPNVGDAAGAVISAPFVEEGAKGLGLIVVLVFFRKYFDDVLDGIVFAGVIALGFSTVENVLYYGRALGAGGFGALAVTFVMRGIMSPFCHATFTSMTGIGCGISRESHNKIIRVIAPIVGYFFAVGLHMFWNGMAVIGGEKAFLTGYFIAEIPFFLIFVVFTLFIMRRQNKILKEMLAIDVALGLIPPELESKATSAFRSFGWLVSGIFEGKFGARSKYLRAVGKLGLSYWHIQRATKAHGQTASFQQNPILREEVLKWRDAV